MTVLIHDIDSYKIQYYGGSLPGTNLAATVECYSGFTLKASIQFIKEGAAVPQNAKPQFSTEFNLYYPISRFNDVLTILRYEKPLRLVLDDSTLKGYLDTKDKEPTGEQET